MSGQLGGCVDGRHHTEIITADDDDFDRVAFGEGFDQVIADRWQFGYCAACLMPHRWSIAEQMWRPWKPGAPEVTSTLELSWELLEELHTAVKQRRNGFNGTVGALPLLPPVLDRTLRRLDALDSAIAAEKDTFFGVPTPPSPGQVADGGS